MALRMRFSLANLVLVVLLVASCATFWWNWRDWQPVGTYQVKGCIEDVIVTSDEKIIGVISVFGNEGGCLDLRSATSGELIKSIDLHPKILNVFFRFSTNDKYVYAANRQNILAVWDLKTGAELVSTNPSISFCSDLMFLKNSNRALCRHVESYEWKLVEFPSMMVLRDFPNQHPVINSTQHQNHWFAFCSDGECFLYNDDGEFVYRIDCSGGRSCIAIYEKCGRVLFKDSESNAGKLYDLKSKCFLDIPEPFRIAKYFNDTSNDYTPFVGVDYSLNVYDPATNLCTKFAPANSMRWAGETPETCSVFNHTVYVTGSASAWDAISGKKLSSFSRDLYLETSGSGRYRIANKGADSRIVADLQTGGIDFLPSYRWPEMKRVESQFKILERPSIFISYESDGDRKDRMGSQRDAPNNSQYTIWRRTMPNKYLGALTMPEFWIMLALATLLGWNIVRNFRRAPIAR